jgi:antagonist of KipI
MTIEVREAGPLTTVQDLGRYGWSHLGISAGGAADSLSLRIANLLVGNDAGAAALEMTLKGGRFYFPEPAVIAIAGSDFQARRNGQPIAPWHSYRLDSGDELQFGFTRQGARAYLAIRGGIAVPLWLGSAATLLGAAAGGYLGRALRPGDHLEVGPTDPTCHSTYLARQATPVFVPENPATLLLLEGQDWNALDDRSRQEFLSAEFTVTEHSNRAGLRLRGPSLTLPGHPEPLTEGVVWGTIQVPPSGQPVILMNDQQTTGGYPKVAHVIASDWPRLGQLRPGDHVRFETVSRQVARALLVEQEKTVKAAVRSI